jgi:hypothetical protein
MYTKNKPQNVIHSLMAAVTLLTAGSTETIQRRNNSALQQFSAATIQRRNNSALQQFSAATM